MRNEYLGDRLIALRELEAVTQAELAKAFGVTPSAVTHVVNGDRPFPEAWARIASEKYRVPVEFFAVAPTAADTGILTYKKKSTARVRDEKRVSRLYSEAARLFRHASRESRYRTADLPDPADFADDPELVAQEIRRRAGLSQDEPIANVTRLCERLGVGVIDQLDPRLQEDPRHSGASRPSPFEDRPVIALAAELGPAMKRFVLAHELYHLIADRDLTRPLTSTRDSRELRANRFAGALLLPAAVAQASLSPSMTLHGYLPVKAEFGVEVRGLIHRAKDLRIINPERERSLYIQWSSNGWRTAEPVPVADERPLLLAQALQQAEGKNYSARLSHKIGVPADLISYWTETAGPPPGPQTASIITLSDRRRLKS